jgi:integrase/recombinase XerC
MTPEDFIAYLRHEKRASHNTLTAYQSDLLQFSKFCKDRFDLLSVKQAQEHMVREWLAKLKSSGFSNRSINRKKSSLSAFFKYTQLVDASASNPAAALSSLKIRMRTAQFVPESDMKRHDAAPEDQFILLRNYLVVEFLYQTGMRRAEILSLTRSHFDLGRQTVKFTGKGNKERIIPLAPGLTQLIERYYQLKEKLFPGSTGFIVSRSGKPLSATSLHNIVVRELGALTTLEKRSPHVLRHTFATHLLNNGAPLIAVKELLGHSSLAATQVYTHNSIAQLKKIHQQAHPKG